jgi:hypothetical protein
MTERTRSNVISIHRAKIKTMSVSVKALTLNNRQMTLSTFRQLLEEDLINHDGTLNGVPWGSVNYCPDKQCGGPEKHWHVVWQKGDELRRDTILANQMVRGFRIGRRSYRRSRTLCQSSAARCL